MSLRDCLTVQRELGSETGWKIIVLVDQCISLVVHHHIGQDCTSG